MNHNHITILENYNYKFSVLEKKKNLLLNKKVLLIIIKIIK